MERRIKIIYWLTIVTLFALVIVQGYWLLNQYQYTLHQYADELFQKTIHAGEVDKELRKGMQDKQYEILTQWKMEVTPGDTSSRTTEMKWVIDVCMIDKNQFLSLNYDSIARTELQSTFRQGLKRFKFEIKDSNHEYNVYDLLEKFQINALCPFNVQRFDSLLQIKSIKVLSIEKEVGDSLIWKPKRIGYESFCNPIMGIIYPFNPLEKEYVKVTCKLDISPILSKMFGTLFCSAIFSLLLIFCLVYQIKTIFKQRRIEELRKSFIKTMIHELKRPVTTLKMCVSFMKSEHLVQDKGMKEDMIRSSQYELDNLSSYFSKLRDLTYDDMEEIPLNLSVFDMEELVKECIGQQTLPADRKIQIKTSFNDSNFDVKADRMHLRNIVCNLLENAIKYSEGDSQIRVNCRLAKDQFIIEVLDNGIGISLTESSYIFDKYYRSTCVVDKNIPGIGLGLCYVKLLVKAHNGKISVESTLGIGSKFIIEIPVNR